MFEGCSEDNWDGYGGRADTASARDEAAVVLEALPNTIPLPEVSAEPDGSIALEWFRRQDYVFSLSVNGKGILVYAGLIGTGNRAHGTEVFDGSLPPAIAGILKRLYG